MAQLFQQFMPAAGLTFFAGYEMPVLSAVKYPIIEQVLPHYSVKVRLPLHLSYRLPFKRREY